MSKVNLKTKIVSIKGEVMRKSFPSKVELEACGNETDKLPDETLENILLNCLSTFPVRNKREVFYINDIAGRIINAENGELEFTANDKDLLSDVLYAQTHKVVNGQKEGIYLNPVIAQAYKILEIKDGE